MSKNTYEANASQNPCVECDMACRRSIFSWEKKRAAIDCRAERELRFYVNIISELRHSTVTTPSSQKAKASGDYGERAWFRNHGNLNIIHQQRFGAGSHIVTIGNHANPKSKVGGGRIKRARKSAQIKRIQFVPRPRRPRRQELQKGILHLGQISRLRSGH